MRSTIICVDDDKFMLDSLVDQLRSWIGDNYSVEKALGGYEALEILDDCMDSGVPVSIVISDYIMPRMQGDELLAKIHEKDKSIRKIMLTGYSQVEGIVNAINLASLYRFISKPWDKKDLMLTVIEALKSYEQEKNNKNLLQSFEKLYRGYELQINYITQTMAGAIDRRANMDPEHSSGVAEISQRLGKAVGMSSDALKTLYTMAAFHDIGRIILPENDMAFIRANESSLYDYPEYIKKQSDAARQIFITNTQMDTELLKGITLHYEKYDGTGVNKMAGQQIPLEARIIGLASYYYVISAGLRSMSVSRVPLFMKLRALQGTMFDPELVGYLEKIIG